MAGAASGAKKKFIIELIKPSHYDDDGYVLQWWKAWIPSNALACLYGLCQDLDDRKVLGDDVEVEINLYDEMNAFIPFKKIIRRFKENDNHGLICMVGVQSNQFPRTMDIVRQFRPHGIPMVIGGFHVSGCISMLKELPPDIQEAVDMGVSLFAGEAEERMEEVVRDAFESKLKPVYNYLNDLPGLQDQVVPFLPRKVVERYDGLISCFDAGRGCPFQCSFCTIINVQGRKSRYRSAADVERLVRINLEHGIDHFLITDDNFARNKNWEPILDRLIELREVEGIRLRFFIQVDTLCHKIPNFVEKCARAGCTHVYIGLENINPDNLMAVKKKQNRITEYRTMFQMWREQKVITYAGFIMGFPNDTRESMFRDMDIIMRELGVDLMEYTMLTPLPGSEDHKILHDKGVWMDPDMNKYDLEHVTTKHPNMSPEEWQQTYHDVWDYYYRPEHVETLMKRAVACGIKPVRVWQNVLQIHGSMRFEGVHPQQCGYIRLKLRSQRRSDLPRENPLVFYPKYVWQTLAKYWGFGLYAWQLHKIRKRVENDPASKSYMDLALTPVDEAEEEKLEMFELNDSSKAAVAKARTEAEARAKAHASVAAE